MSYLTSLKPIESVKLARYTLKLLYRRCNSYMLFIYIVVKYIVELERNKKYGIFNMLGFKTKVIPEEIYDELIRKELDAADIYESQHCIFVPNVFFENMYAENILYRDGRSLWMSLEMKLNKEVIKKVEDINSDVINVNKYLRQFSIENLLCKQSKDGSPIPLQELQMKPTFSGDCNRRIVQIAPLRSVNMHYVYMTECEYFNIKNNYNALLVHESFTLKINPIISSHLAPHIAKQIVIQRVNTTNSIETDLTDLLLNNYFKTPKFIHKNDYFGIPLDEKYAGHLYYKYFTCIKHHRKVYFKCIDIKSSSFEDGNESTEVGYFVVKGETDLVQEQNFNSFIPPLQYYPLLMGDISNDNFNIDTTYISSCPFGLDKYLNEIKMAVHPFILNKKVSPLHNELKCVMQSVFLLRGDLGSGSHVLASRLAEHLGMHFFHCSSRQLSASTAKQTEVKIDVLLQRAKHSAPVVLHLQDFEVFGLDPENNEDSRIVENFFKKLKDLYEHFTKLPIIIICSCDSSSELKPNISRLFLEEFHIKNPNKSERTELLKWMTLVNNLKFCNDSFQPLLHSNEPMFNIESKVILPEIKSILDTDFETKTKSMTNIDVSEINKPELRKKGKKGIGKKSKKNNSQFSPQSNASTEIRNIALSEDSALAMVSLEEQLMTSIVSNTAQVENTNQDAVPLTNLVTELPKDTDSILSVPAFARCESFVRFNEKVQCVLEKVSCKTETFLYGDLDTFIHLSLTNGYLAQKRKANEDKDKIGITGDPVIGCVREKDFEDAIESLRLIQSKRLASLKIPNIQWEDIGGLEDLKKEISRTIELPLKYPHLLANSGLKRSGLLLWGPPGCGKTLVARAVASQLQAAFLSVKGPELLDMYVGQSEKNVRDMFAAARACAPCVIFLDEAEAAAGARGASGDSGGVADRLVSQLLAELDGVASQQNDAQTGPVIVVAATNRPDLVEPALLRPGRLDKLLYVGPYEGVNNKLRVLKASCRGYNLTDSVDLEAVCHLLPERCTGADLAAVINRARKFALIRAVHKAEKGDVEPSQLTEKDILITDDDFQKSVVDFVPSISINEMNYYESLRSKLL